ncbi:MAG: hypothetical protein ICV61_00310 [Microcoleus sp. Co-bin12]|nr:hypothetical protein [Microcoleus sp. Co-bin12]
METLSSMDLKATGGHGGHNSPLSKKSESLLLSYLAEPEEFAEQIRKAIALEIEEALKGKAKAKLRDEVSHQNSFDCVKK